MVSSNIGLVLGRNDSVSLPAGVSSRIGSCWTWAAISSPLMFPLMSSVLARNQESLANFDTHFSHKVVSHGITNQKQSGRCWLFTGLNVLRAQMMAKYGLDELTFSQNYCFFYDQLEKANLFLQGIIDTSKKPLDDKMLEWLFRNPLNDGGQFTGISDIIGKYGVVPSEVMPETYSSENTAQISRLVGLKLKEFGLDVTYL